MAALLTDADLAEARALQEALMTAACVVRAPGDGWVWNGTADVPAVGQVLYSGKCRVQPEPQHGVTVAGGQDVPSRIFVGAVPWMVTGLAPGHTVEVTACMDPDLIGARLTVVDVEGQTVALTARRFKAVRSR